MVGDMLNSRVKARASSLAVSLRRGYGMLSGLAVFLGLRLESSLKTLFSAIEISGMVGCGLLPCDVEKAEPNWWFKISAFILLSLHVTPFISRGILPMYCFVCFSF